MALLETDFVESTLNDLLKYGRIYEVSKTYTISPLSVAHDSRGKKRLILDPSFINQFVFKQKIKFDDWKVFKQYFNA